MPPIIPLTSDTPRLHHPASRSPVAQRHANALSTKAAQIPVALRMSCHHTVCPHTRSKHITRYHRSSRSPPRLHQHVSRSPVARRHANTLPSKAAQFPIALQHRERNCVTRFAHTLEANMSHDTTNHPDQGRANPNGTATRFHPKPSLKASPNGSALAPYCERRRTVANGCGQLRTVADGCGRLRTLRQRVANKALPPDPQS